MRGIERERPERRPAFFIVLLCIRLPAWLSALPPSSAVAAPATSTAATGVSLGSRARLIDVDRAAIHLNAVELFNGLRRCVRVHFDESEAARATGVPVRHDRGRLDCTY